mgnify:CR=1 FL=1
MVMRPPIPILTGLSLIWVCSCHADEAPLGDGQLSLASVATDVSAIIEAYPTWGGPVDFQLRFGPRLCDIPPVEPRFSESAPGGPHAEKLYLVHAYDATAYADVPGIQEAAAHLAAPAKRPPIPPASRRRLDQQGEPPLGQKAFVMRFPRFPEWRAGNDGHPGLDGRVF